jgi:hypothetical protein
MGASQSERSAFRDAYDLLGRSQGVFDVLQCVSSSLGRWVWTRGYNLQDKREGLFLSKFIRWWMVVQPLWLSLKYDASILLQWIWFVGRDPDNGLHDQKTPLPDRCVISWLISSTNNTVAKYLGYDMPSQVSVCSLRGVAAETTCF